MSQHKGNVLQIRTILGYQTMESLVSSLKTSGHGEFSFFSKNEWAVLAGWLFETGDDGAVSACIGM